MKMSESGFTGLKDLQDYRYNAMNRLKILILAVVAGFGTVAVFAQKPSDFEAKAQQGDTEAQYRLGHCYDYGEGVKSDYPTAFQWYEKAAKQRHANATAELGGFYYNGYVVEKNYDRAVALFREAEQKGSAHAQYWLGICYYRGNGVAKNLETAVSWYRKAAEQGFAEAQYNLATCYYRGKGVEKNMDTALSWYQKSANQGNADAKKRIEQIAIQKMPRTKQLQTLKKGDEISGNHTNRWREGSSSATITGKVVEWNADKTEILIEITRASTYSEDDRWDSGTEDHAYYKGEDRNTSDKIWVSNLYNIDSEKGYVWTRIFD
jgi:hypothetical protein